MNQSPRVFISHTTRDRRDLALAHKLAAGLEARGARVWIAPESIPAGNEWREEIVAGVLDGCSHFLVLLSAASVTAKWVLEEIRLAKKRRKRDPRFEVLPLIAGTLGDHPHKRFLDKLQAVPYHDDFHAQLEAVVQAVGLRPSLPDQVSAFVEERTRDFVGRAHVFAAIDGFLAAERSGYFTVVGDPGVGKSALLARFVQQTDCVAHFNIRAQGIDSTAQFLESVCVQLIRRFGLPYSTLPAGATNDGRFLAALLTEAAGRLEEGERLPVAVDALDEVELAGTAGNILYLPVVLPAGVYFVMSRRPTRVPLSTQSPQETLDLSDYPAESREDVREYIELRLEKSAALRRWLEARRLAEVDFRDALIDRSQCNFMYLRYLLPELEAGRQDTLELAELPVGLEGYYEDHWRRMGMTTRPLPRDKIRIVYVLSVARQPISREEITRFARDERMPIDELAVQEVLDEWEEFLHEQPGGGTTLYSLYHQSFRDFLHRQDVVQAAGTTLSEVSGRVADELWGEIFGGGAGAGGE